MPSPPHWRNFCNANKNESHPFEGGFCFYCRYKVGEVGPEGIAAADRVEPAAAVFITAALQCHLCTDSRLRHGQRFTAAAAGTVSIVLEALTAAVVEGFTADAFHRWGSGGNSRIQGRGAGTGHKQTSFPKIHPILCRSSAQRSRQKFRRRRAILKGKGGRLWEFMWTFCWR